MAGGGTLPVLEKVLMPIRGYEGVIEIRLQSISALAMRKPCIRTVDAWAHRLGGNCRASREKPFCARPSSNIWKLFGRPANAGKLVLEAATVR